MKTLTVDADPRRRAVAFLEAWLAAPPGADIEFRRARSETGIPAIAISINGAMSGFTTAEARILADIAESTMRAFPQETASMADLIMGLRMSADKAEKHRVLA